MASRARTPDEIRASIEANRHELAHSLTRLRGEITVASDWRGQIQRHVADFIARLRAIAG